MCDEIYKSLFKNEQENNLLNSVQNYTVGFCINLQELRSMCAFFSPQLTIPCA